MSVSEVLDAIQAWLVRPLFSIGNSSASLGNILLALVFIGAIWWFGNAAPGVAVAAGAVWLSVAAAARAVWRSRVIRNFILMVGCCSTIW